MKLYNSSVAPNPRRVRIFLAEKNIQVPMEEVDLAKGVHKQPAFLEKNPMGAVPVLELDDGTCVAESVAICRYFEMTNPEPPLFGTGAKEAAVVEMWQRRIELYVFTAIGDVFRNTSDFFKGRIEQVPEYGRVQLKNVGERLNWLDRELANRRFVAGDKYTIADVTLLVALMFGESRANIKVAPDQKNLARWFAEVSARPSAKA